jgi:hypothetical protein
VLRLLAAVLTLALLVGTADAQRRPLSDEECTAARLEEGARAYRPITGETDPARQSAALRSTWGIGALKDGIPLECRGRPTASSIQPVAQPPAAKRQPDAQTLKSGSDTGKGRCVTRHFGTGASVSICE